MMQIRTAGQSEMVTWREEFTATGEVTTRLQGSNQLARADHPQLGGHHAQVIWVGPGFATSQVAGQRQQLFLRSSWSGSSSGNRGNSNGRSSRLGDANRTTALGQERRPRTLDLNHGSFTIRKGL